MVQRHPVPRKRGSELPGVRQNVQKDRNSHRVAPVISTAKSRFDVPTPSLFPLLTVNEVALILKISARSVRRMIVDKRLSVIRLGRAIRVAATCKCQCCPI
jgi:excisionase family DNA binding protein